MSEIIELKAMEVLKVFKGDKELEPSKVKLMAEGFNRGYLKLRGFERILFSTGKYISFPKDCKSIISVNKEFFLNKGLYIYPELYAGNRKVKKDFVELSLLIYNSSPFLSSVNKEEVIANLFIADGESVKII